MAWFDVYYVNLLELAQIIPVVLYVIFDRQLQNSSVQDEWKDGNAMAIFK